jgi:hypothetical protein
MTKRMFLGRRRVTRLIPESFFSPSPRRAFLALRSARDWIFSSAAADVVVMLMVRRSVRVDFFDRGHFGERKIELGDQGSSFVCLVICHLLPKTAKLVLLL